MFFARSPRASRWGSGRLRSAPDRRYRACACRGDEAAPLSLSRCSWAAAAAAAGSQTGARSALEECWRAFADTIGYCSVLLTLTRHTARTPNVRQERAAVGSSQGRGPRSTVGIITDNHRHSIGRRRPASRHRHTGPSALPSRARLVGVGV